MSDSGRDRRDSEASAAVSSDWEMDIPGVPHARSRRTSSLMRIKERRLQREAEQQQQQLQQQQHPPPPPSSASSVPPLPPSSQPHHQHQHQHHQHHDASASGATPELPPRPRVRNISSVSSRASFMHSRGSQDSQAASRVSELEDQLERTKRQHYAAVRERDEAEEVSAEQVQKLLEEIERLKAREVTRTIQLRSEMAEEYGGESQKFKMESAASQAKVQSLTVENQRAVSAWQASRRIIEILLRRIGREKCLREHYRMWQAATLRRFGIINSFGTGLASGRGRGAAADVSADSPPTRADPFSGSAAGVGWEASELNSEASPDLFRVGTSLKLVESVTGTILPLKVSADGSTVCHASSGKPLRAWEGDTVKIREAEGGGGGFKTLVRTSEHRSPAAEATPVVIPAVRNLKRAAFSRLSGGAPHPSGESVNPKHVFALVPKTAGRKGQGGRAPATLPRPTSRRSVHDSLSGRVGVRDGSLGERVVYLDSEGVHHLADGREVLVDPATSAPVMTHDSVCVVKIFNESPSLRSDATMREKDFYFCTEEGVPVAMHAGKPFVWQCTGSVCAAGRDGETLLDPFGEILLSERTGDPITLSRTTWQPRDSNGVSVDLRGYDGKFAEQIRDDPTLGSNEPPVSTPSDPKEKGGDQGIHLTSEGLWETSSGTFVVAAPDNTPLRWGNGAPAVVADDEQSILTPGRSGRCIEDPRFPGEHIILGSTGAPIGRDGSPMRLLPDGTAVVASDAKPLTPSAATATPIGFSPADPQPGDFSYATLTLSSLRLHSSGGAPQPDLLWVRCCGVEQQQPFGERGLPHPGKALFQTSSGRVGGGGGAPSVQFGESFRAPLAAALRFEVWGVVGGAGGGLPSSGPPSTASVSPPQGTPEGGESLLASGTASLWEFVQSGLQSLPPGVATLQKASGSVQLSAGGGVAASPGVMTLSIDITPLSEGGVGGAAESPWDQLASFGLFLSESAPYSILIPAGGAPGGDSNTSDSPQLIPLSVRPAGFSGPVEVTLDPFTGMVRLGEAAEPFSPPSPEVGKPPGNSSTPPLSAAVGAPGGGGGGNLPDLDTASLLSAAGMVVTSAGEVLCRQRGGVAQQKASEADGGEGGGEPPTLVHTGLRWDAEKRAFAPQGDGTGGAPTDPPEADAGLLPLLRGLGIPVAEGRGGATDGGGILWDPEECRAYSPVAEVGGPSPPPPTATPAMPPPPPASATLPDLLRSSGIDVDFATGRVECEGNPLPISWRGGGADPSSGPPGGGATPRFAFDSEAQWVLCLEALRGSVPNSPEMARDALSALGVPASVPESRPSAHPKPFELVWDSVDKVFQITPQGSGGGRTLELGVHLLEELYDYGISLDRESLTLGIAMPDGASLPLSRMGWDKHHLCFTRERSEPDDPDAGAAPLAAACFGILQRYSLGLSEGAITVDGFATGVAWNPQAAKFEASQGVSTATESPRLDLSDRGLVVDKSSGRVTLAGNNETILPLQWSEGRFREPSRDITRVALRRELAARGIRVAESGGAVYLLASRGGNEETPLPLRWDDASCRFVGGGEAAAAAAAASSSSSGKLSADAFSRIPSPIPDASLAESLPGAKGIHGIPGDGPIDAEAASPAPMAHLGGRGGGGGAAQARSGGAVLPRDASPDFFSPESEVAKLLGFLSQHGLALALPRSPPMSPADGAPRQHQRRKGIKQLFVTGGDDITPASARQRHPLPVAFNEETLRFEHSPELVDTPPAPPPAEGGGGAHPPCDTPEDRFASFSKICLSPFQPESEVTLAEGDGGGDPAPLQIAGRPVSIMEVLAWDYEEGRLVALPRPVDIFTDILDEIGITVDPDTGCLDAGPSSPSLKQQQGVSQQHHHHHPLPHPISTCLVWDSARQRVTRGELSRGETLRNITECLAAVGLRIDPDTSRLSAGGGGGGAGGAGGVPPTGGVGSDAPPPPDPLAVSSAGMGEERQAAFARLFSAATPRREIVWSESALRFSQEGGGGGGGGGGARLASSTAHSARIPEAVVEVLSLAGLDVDPSTRLVAATPLAPAEAARCELVWDPAALCVVSRQAPRRSAAKRSRDIVRHIFDSPGFLGTPEEQRSLGFTQSIRWNESDGYTISPIPPREQQEAIHAFLTAHLSGGTPGETRRGSEGKPQHSPDAVPLLDLISWVPGGAGGGGGGGGGGAPTATLIPVLNAPTVSKLLGVAGGEAAHPSGVPGGGGGLICLTRSGGDAGTSGKRASPKLVWDEGSMSFGKVGVGSPGGAAPPPRQAARGHRVKLSRAEQAELRRHRKVVDTLAACNLRIESGSHAVVHAPPGAAPIRRLADIYTEGVGDGGGGGDPRHTSPHPLLGFGKKQISCDISGGRRAFYTCDPALAALAAQPLPGSADFREKVVILPHGRAQGRGGVAEKETPAGPPRIPSHASVGQPGQPFEVLCALSTLVDRRGNEVPIFRTPSGEKCLSNGDRVVYDASTGLPVETCFGIAARRGMPGGAEEMGVEVRMSHHHHHATRRNPRLRHNHLDDLSSEGWSGCSSDDDDGTPSSASSSASSDSSTTTSPTSGRHRISFASVLPADLALPLDARGKLAHAQSGRPLPPLIWGTSGLAAVVSPTDCRSVLSPSGAAIPHPTTGEPLQLVDGALCYPETDRRGGSSARNPLWYHIVEVSQLPGEAPHPGMPGDGRGRGGGSVAVLRDFDPLRDSVDPAVNKVLLRGGGGEAGAGRAMCSLATATYYDANGPRRRTAYDPPSNSASGRSTPATPSPSSAAPSAAPAKTLQITPDGVVCTEEGESVVFIEEGWSQHTVDDAGAPQQGGAPPAARGAPQSSRVVPPPHPRQQHSATVAATGRRGVLPVYTAQSEVVVYSRFARHPLLPEGSEAPPEPITLLYVSKASFEFAAGGASGQTHPAAGSGFFASRVTGLRCQFIPTSPALAGGGGGSGSSTTWPVMLPGNAGNGFRVNTAASCDESGCLLLAPQGAAGALAEVRGEPVVMVSATASPDAAAAATTAGSTTPRHISAASGAAIGLPAFYNAPFLQSLGGVVFPVALLDHNGGKGGGAAATATTSGGATTSDGINGSAGTPEAVLGLLLQTSRPRCYALYRDGVSYDPGSATYKNVRDKSLYSLNGDRVCTVPGSSVPLASGTPSLRGEVVVERWSFLRGGHLSLRYEMTSGEPVVPHPEGSAPFVWGNSTVAHTAKDRVTLLSPDGRVVASRVDGTPVLYDAPRGCVVESGVAKPITQLQDTPGETDMRACLSFLHSQDVLSEYELSLITGRIEAALASVGGGGGSQRRGSAVSAVSQQFRIESRGGMPTLDSQAEALRQLEASIRKEAEEIDAALTVSKEEVLALLDKTNHDAEQRVGEVFWVEASEMQERGEIAFSERALILSLLSGFVSDVVQRHDSLPMPLGELPPPSLQITPTLLPTFIQSVRGPQQVLPPGSGFLVPQAVTPSQGMADGMFVPPSVRLPTPTDYGSTAGAAGVRPSRQRTPLDVPSSPPLSPASRASEEVARLHLPSPLSPRVRALSEGIARREMLLNTAVSTPAAAPARAPHVPGGLQVNVGEKVGVTAPGASAEGSLRVGETGVVVSVDDWCERPYLVEGPRGDTHWYTPKEIATLPGVRIAKGATVTRSPPLSPQSQGSPYVLLEGGDIVLNELS